MLGAIMKAEGREDAARRSRRRDRSPTNPFFKGVIKREDDAVRVPFDRPYAKRFPQGANLIVGRVPLRVFGCAAARGRRRRRGVFGGVVVAVATRWVGY